ncbi:PIN-like domain-containing protein [Sporosarcina sp. D27]|uniref:PIN-like domain-containing protein n=1 Tax=Sporosarcina sp. D27 TaxID=1382305 RepID=UPI000471FF9D|nr:PIN-like domain-containing protein [Sporosarcina sp. D27]
MRKKFREFYNNDSINFENLKEDVLIVFDTNTLLNIYRYSSATSDTFIKSIKKVENNIWIPYQVGMEFNLNRKKVMNDVKKAPVIFKEDFENKIDNLINGVKNDLGNYFLKSIDAKEIKNQFIIDLTSQLNDVKEKILQNNFVSLSNLVDTERDKLTELIDTLDDKVGDPSTQKEITKICEEGANRYAKEIPPGYMDKKKGVFTYFNGLEFESKYGDLIVWEQIINRAKDPSINTVVIITDDSKEDWWYKIGIETVGPRAELKNELIRKANADLIMINSNTFLKQTNIEEVTEDLVDESNTYSRERNIPSTGEIQYFENRIEDFAKINPKNFKVQQRFLFDLDSDSELASDLRLRLEELEKSAHFYLINVNEQKEYLPNIIKLVVTNKLQELIEEIEFLKENIEIVSYEKVDSVENNLKHLINSYINLSK